MWKYGLADSLCNGFAAMIIVYFAGRDEALGSIGYRMGV